MLTRTGKGRIHNQGRLCGHSGAHISSPTDTVPIAHIQWKHIDRYLVKTKQVWHQLLLDDGMVDHGGTECIVIGISFCLVDPVCFSFSHNIYNRKELDFSWAIIRVIVILEACKTSNESERSCLKFQ